jgi:hypothetical protein
MRPCCMQVDGQFFYTGSPWELQAREYAAMTLNTAAAFLSNIAKQQEDQQQQQGPQSGLPSHSQPRRLPSLPPSTSALDMIGVSAMEAIGVSEALTR